MNDLLQLVREYLEANVYLRRQMKNERQGYYGPEDLVLRRGTVFHNGGLYGSPIPRACFYRSYQAATRKGSKWIYCEGFAVQSQDIPLPVWHGWLMRPDEPGIAYDAAWMESEGAVYLGVPLTVEAIRRCRRRSGEYGFLYNVFSHEKDVAAAIWKR